MASKCKVNGKSGTRFQKTNLCKNPSLNFRKFSRADFEKYQTKLFPFVYKLSAVSPTGINSNVIISFIWLTFSSLVQFNHYFTWYQNQPKNMR